MMQAQQKTEAVQKREAKPDRSDFQLPELSELIKEAPVAQELTADAAKEAFELAKSVDFNDPLEAMNFGLDEQQRASKVTRQFLEEVRNSNLEELVDLAVDQNQKMEELNIGELETGTLQKVMSYIMPKKQAAKVQAFLDKHRSLSELIDENEKALVEERLKLQELRGRMDGKIGENQEVYDGLTGKIAAAELAYAGNKRNVMDFKEKNKDTQDAAIARDVSLMDKALAMQARRINSLKASRQETLNALNTMDLQVQRIDSQIQMIDEQRHFNRLVWDNTVMMLATDRQMRSSVEAVKYNRESIERQMKNRTGSIGETLQKIIAEEKTGVINAAVLEFAANETIRLNRMIIEGNKAIRDAMSEADKVIERIDAQVKHSLSHSAAQTDDDLKQLDEYLKLPERPKESPRKPA